MKLTTNNCIQISCPYCGQLESHLGSCVLSMMNTGKYNVVVAISTPFTIEEEINDEQNISP